MKGSQSTSHESSDTGLPPGSAQFLKDAKVPAVIVESEKAALAIAACAEKAGRRLLVIATGGCWSFRGRIGKTENANGARVDETGLLPDFHLIEWNSRRSIVLFDARPNHLVSSARRTLSAELRNLGGEVRQATFRTMMTWALVKMRSRPITTPVAMCSSPFLLVVCTLTVISAYA